MTVNKKAESANKTKGKENPVVGFGAEFYELLATRGHGKDETVVPVLLEIVGTMISALETKRESIKNQPLVKKNIGDMAEAINGLVDAINVDDGDDDLSFGTEYENDIYDDFDTSPENEFL